MTRKDYELIAEVIREFRNTCGDTFGDVTYFTLLMADRLAAANPRFNRDKFLAATTGD